MQAPIPLYLLCVLSLAWPGLGQAQAIYKSVDAQGNVTYSSRPPPAAAGVEPVTVQENANREANLKAERIRQETASRAAENQKKRAADQAQKEAAISEAKKRVRDAQDKLDTARRRGDDDWQTIARGGRVEGDSYRTRVTQAERQLHEAERGLKDAKAGKLPPEDKAKAQAKTEPAAGQSKGKDAPAVAQSKGKDAAPPAKSTGKSKDAVPAPKSTSTDESETPSTARH
jgi:hypothetical protein